LDAGVFRSLRFQLPALFFVGVVVSGLVSAAIAFQLIESYTLSRARADLRREARGITRLYIEQASGSNDPVPAPQLEAATGDRIYYVPPAPGTFLFPGKQPHLRVLPKTAIDFGRRRRSSLCMMVFSLEHDLGTNEIVCPRKPDTIFRDHAQAPNGRSSAREMMWR